MKSLFPAMMLLLTACCNSSVEPAHHRVNAPEKRLQQLNWLIGRWENNSTEGNLSEIWEEKNDSTFSGASYFVIQGDTVFAESVQLAERDGKITYCVTIPGQNKEEEVCFELTKLNGKQLIFENPKHDYPSKITYFNKADSLIAEISGKVKGASKSEFFRMKKAIQKRTVYHL